MKNKWVGLFWVLVCYLVALLAAVLSVMYLPFESPVYKALAADIIATAAVFGFSVIFRNASFYDAYWSVAPVFIALYWKYSFGGMEWSIPEIVSFLVILVWSVRLTTNWYRGWEGLSHEDWRYKQLREQTGKSYPLVNFSGIHLFPTLIVFAACLPLISVYTSDAMSLDLVSVFAIITGLAAAAIQWFADEQMRAHRAKKRFTNKKEIIDTGLWKYSRHPNYFGEILFWFSILLFGISAGNMEWWMYSGIICMILLFVFISIPLMENRMLVKYPQYIVEQKRKSSLIPWFKND